MSWMSSFQLQQNLKLHDFYIKIKQIKSKNMTRSQRIGYGKRKNFLKLFNKLFSIENIKYLRIFLYNIMLKYLIYLLEKKKR